MTNVALQAHKKDLIRETPNFAKKKFLYRLSRSDYEKQWGKDYTRPGVGTRILSTLLRYMQVKMYGERFEIVSDPFNEGDCIAVRATSGSNPEIRTVLLPIAILLGIADRFLKRPT